MDADARVPWTVAEPARAEREQAEMRAVAPELSFDGVVWHGTAPVWPFERPRPDELVEFLAGRRLLIVVTYSPAFPMVAPKVVPVAPQPDIARRTDHDWHLNGDGSLCLLQSAADWDGTGTAAELVVKAAGWFLEYLLLVHGRVDKMTEAGIAADDQLDHLFTVEVA